MKVLIFGGSFDPVHKGHISLLKSALAQIAPDITYVVPAFHSPFKQESHSPFSARLQMARGAFSKLKGKIVFDDYENRNGRLTYAWEAVRYIKAKHPRAQIYLLVGTDCFNDVSKWKRADYLFKNCVITAGRRKGYAGDFKPGFKHFILKGSFPLLSSTSIRLKIMLSGVVPQNTEQRNVIIKHGLYGLREHAWLRRRLKENRYLHSKAVAALAAELAGVYGANKERAALAGLLHDAAKCMADKDLVKYCLKHKIRPEYFDEICRYEPSLLHSYASAFMTEHVFGVKDKEILDAVAQHTLGGDGMTLLSKVLYVADMASKDRKYAHAAHIRALARKDLDAAFTEATKRKLLFTIQANKWICPRGNKTWNMQVKALRSKTR